MSVNFELPAIHDNADGSWGPSSSTIPAQFKDIPYAPFSKSDKITRIADWHDPAFDPNNQNRNRPAGQTGRRTREAYGASESNLFGYVHEEDEKSFSLVESGARAATRPRGQILRGGPKRPFAPRGAPRGGFRGRGGFSGRGRGGGGRGGYNDRPQRIRDSSVTVGNDWQELESLEFARLLKLNLGVEEAETLESHGTLQGYDRGFDRVNTRNDKPLKNIDRVRYNLSTSDDPIIAELAKKKTGQIFTTDTILSVLMTAPRSVNSWDIIFEKRGDQVFIDKRDGGPFDYVTVNENAQDPPEDSDNSNDINSSSNLSLEATYISQNFSFQVIEETSKPYTPNPNPFYSPEDEQDPVASCLYRYRKFDLSVGEEETMDLVLRTEVDAYIGKRAVTCTVKALNEFNPGGASKSLDWRKNLDLQKGAIVASEMKNNSAKLARWAVQSVLAGADQMKLGYISRANPRDASRHSIVGVQSYKPADFARQMNVSLGNGWGIVRTLVDVVLKQDDGKFVLVKDPNNKILRLYKVPDNTFEVDGDDV